MNDVMIVTEHFLITLGFALALFSIIASSKLTGAGFMKLITSVAGGCMVLALPLHLRYALIQSPQSIAMLIFIVASILVYFFHRDQKGFAMWLLWGLQVFSGIITLNVLHNNDMEQLLWAISSAGLVGIVTYAMILGHWYLVVPKLSERPLVISTIILWLIMIAKIIWAVFEVDSYSEFYQSGSMQGAGYMFNVILLLMRAAWGYLVIGVMSYFAWRLIRMRSIQSATGMLYAMTFFVLVGELMAQFMFFKYGIKI